jgi:hypothetical protein
MESLAILSSSITLQICSFSEIEKKIFFFDAVKLQKPKSCRNPQKQLEVWAKSYKFHF